MVDRSTVDRPCFSWSIDHCFHSFFCYCLGLIFITFRDGHAATKTIHEVEVLTTLGWIGWMHWSDMFRWSIARENVGPILSMENDILNGRNRRKEPRTIPAIYFTSVIGHIRCQNLANVPKVFRSLMAGHRPCQMEIDVTQTGRLTSMIANDEDCRFGRGRLRSINSAVLWRNI